MEDLPIEVPEDTAEKKPTLRGWWDYVPEPQVAHPVQGSPLVKAEQSLHTMRSKLNAFFGSSVPRPQSSSQPPRIPTAVSKDSHGFQTTSIAQATRGTSPTPSSSSRLGNFVPNIHLFQKVIKDELMYTTFITATCVVIAVLAVFGVNFKNGLTVTGWIALNWSIISLLAIHSFGRVVRRHERDALLQHPLTYDAPTRAGALLRGKKLRDSRTSTIAPSRFRREAESNDRDDPFSDTRRLGDSEDYRDSSIAASTSPPSPDLFDEHSRVDLAIPNPFANFPASGYSTPLVPHQSLDDSIVQGFSGSWLLGRASVSRSTRDETEENMHL